jgi:hypothetical protein
MGSLTSRGWLSSLAENAEGSSGRGPMFWFDRPRCARSCAFDDFNKSLSSFEDVTLRGCSLMSRGCVASLAKKPEASLHPKRLDKSVAGFIGPKIGSLDQSRLFLSHDFSITFESKLRVNFVEYGGEMLGGK